MVKEIAGWGVAHPSGREDPLFGGYTAPTPGLCGNFTALLYVFPWKGQGLSRRRNLMKKLLIPLMSVLALGLATAQGAQPTVSQASVTLVRWVEVLPQMVRWEDLGAGRARQIYQALEGLSYGFTPEEAQAAVEALQQLLPEDLLQQLDRAAAQLTRGEDALLYFSAADFEAGLRALLSGAFAAAENGGVEPGE